MALAYFRRRYDLEDRGRDVNAVRRHELRQQEAKPIVVELHRGLVEHYEREWPKAKLRGAIGYRVNRGAAFERYLEKGVIPIENNRTEAALKQAVLGRKAWRFSAMSRAVKPPPFSSPCPRAATGTA